METRASYIAVGGFVLALFAAMIAFVAWIAKVQLETAQDRYLIYFTGAVSGLQPGSPVRYLGIPVGTVTDLRIDPANPQQIRVTVEVTQSTPIKADSVATLELQGLTGGTFVQISAGSTQSRLLAEDEAPWIIRSRPSSLAAAVDATPQLLENLLALSLQLRDLLSLDNQRAVTATLTNVEAISRDLADVSRRLNGTLDVGERAVADIGATANDLRTVLPDVVRQLSGTLAGVDDTVKAIQLQVAPIAGDVRQTTRAFRQSAEQLTELLRENREPLRDFAGTGLYEFTALLSELRELANSLTRFTLRLERDPTSTLIGGPRGGVSTDR